jgi:anti-sigma B factor antagonist
VEAEFGIRSAWDSDIVVIEVRGEIDLATAPEVVSALDAAADARRVVIDLSEATFVDSAAINSLIRCRRHLAERGVDFHLVSPPNGIVRKALEITNVISELAVVDSRAEALS